MSITSIEIDVYEILDKMNRADVTLVVEDMLNSGYIPQGWSKTESVNLSDSAVLLDVIVELRRMGYTVEPGGK